MRKLFFIMLAVLPWGVHAADRYVDLNSLAPALPYANWASAATDIQSAVDVASDGDTIWVTNGVYNTGGRPLSGDVLTNRVCVTNSIEIRSVNGPEVTVIEGAGPLGSNAVRCVVLATNASLSGFTITNGHCGLHGTANHPVDTEDLSRYGAFGGGVVLSGGSVISNCVVIGNTGDFYGGGVCVRNGTIADSVITENDVFHYRGGGVVICHGVITNCMIYNNEASYGGGGIYGYADPYDGYQVRMTDCLIYDNRAGDAYRSGIGGGCDLAGNVVLEHCVISNNWANGLGGGVTGDRDVVFVDCVIEDNWAGDSGGGVRGGTAIDCIIQDNWSEGPGGGMSQASAEGCTIQGNIAFLNDGGGLFDVNATNCIVRANEAENGGGVYSFGDNVLENCLIYNNSAYFDGGGVCSGLVYNCTVADNIATSGGGVFGGSVYNSIVYYNSAEASSNLHEGISASSCSTDVLDGVYGNTTNAPLFANRVGDHYRLASGSPCIDGGINGYAHVPVDLDGNPRFFNDADMGAYEFQDIALDSDGDGLGDAAELRYGTEADNPDSDGDGFEDGWEVVHGWNPDSGDRDVVSYIEEHDVEFGLYSSNAVLDVAMGDALLGISGTNAVLSLQLEQSEDLQMWTNAGEIVEWTLPVDADTKFLRIKSAP
jgi:parallel beta-helix repeat protein